MDKTIKLLFVLSVIFILFLIFDRYIIFILVYIFMYFLPTIIGYHENHKKAFEIFLINLFFGWTGIGWIWMLLVAVNAFRKGSLDVDLITKTLTPDTWDVLKMTVRNASSSELNITEVSFTDGFLSRQEGVYSIKARESETIEIPIQATGRGRVPLKITITYLNSSGLSITQIVDEWIDVALR